MMVMIIIFKLIQIK